MDKEISRDLFEVENPVYQDYGEIEKKYFGYVVVVTEIKNGNDGESLGGTARFYTKTSKKIYDKWGEYENSRQYGKCSMRFLIPGETLGGLYL